MTFKKREEKRSSLCRPRSARCYGPVVRQSTWWW